MIKTKKALNTCIKKEKHLLFEGIEKKGILKYHVVHDHLVDISRYMKYLRKEEYHKNNNGIHHKCMEILYARKKNLLGNKLGFYIGSRVFDEGLIIYHHGSIIVNGYAKVGKNCKLHGCNCIGNAGDSFEAPVIGDNVDIGFGASIIGDVKIGNDIKIGAGAVVTKSFLEDGVTLVGVPAHILEK